MMQRTEFRPCPRPGLTLLTVVLATCLVSGQPAYYESEPNDIPSDANPISGPIVIYGTMPSGDQDAFLLTVSDDDARKRCDFELTGIPGALTVADLLRVNTAEPRIFERVEVQGEGDVRLEF